MYTKNKKIRQKIGKSLLWLALVIIVTIWVVPFFFMIMTSIKSQADVQKLDPFNPPAVAYWQNYPDAIKRVNLLVSIKNSLEISIIKVPLGLIISALAAYALTRLKVPKSRLILALFVFGTMVPIQVALAQLFRIELSLDLLNTKLGIILPYIAFGVPYQVFMFYGFFQSIPKEIDEAARIDGASNLRIFWNIILPLAKPAFAALFVLDFVATWNEYSMALVILQKQASWTVPLALQNFNSTYMTYYGQLNAAIIMSILPVLIVYFCFQRYFVRGIFSGSVKG